MRATLRTTPRLLLTVILAGCFRSSGVGSDSSVEPDGSEPTLDGGMDAFVDGSTEGCEPIGGYTRCGPTCPTADCGPGIVCVDELQICSPQTGFADGVEQGPNNCWIGYEDTDTAEYCWNGDLCAERAGPDGYGDDRFGGRCVREAYCQEVIRTEVGSRCRYSDRSYYADGPPYPDVCPDGGHPLLGFCGGPCGACPVMDLRGVSNDNVDCIGVSESRGWGICAFRGDQMCQRDQRVGQLAGYSDILGETFACLVPFDPSSDDGLARRGWIVLLETCLAYREAFGDEFDCVDDGWASH